ncbi:MAG TPA: hypothetical protein VGP63_14900 [Planctomycetaceae bacterium]|nr:hypothetical protein [Planctomycetaceae bacterium]
MDWNLILATVALLVGCQEAFVAGQKYEGFVPLDLPGCRWTRFPERDALQLEFVAANAQASADCVVARIGLMSLDFWTDRSPPGTFVFGNEWETLDPPTNDLLLSTFGNRMRMMFVDNPKPWYLKTHNLAFSSFVAAQPAHKFLDFVSDHFTQLARVSTWRILVRKERKDLDLFACAYTTGLDATRQGHSLLRIKLPAGSELNDVARIELVDLQTGRWIGSTQSDDRTPSIFLSDGEGQDVLQAARRTLGRASFRAGDDLFLSYPTRLKLEQVPYPALRFISQRDTRLLSLPVGVETCLANDDRLNRFPIVDRSKDGSAGPAIPQKTH